MTSPPLKIIFAGTPEFAATALIELIRHQYHVVAVYTQPDRPAGRGRKLQPSPVKRIALAYDIPLEQPGSFKNAPQTIARLEAYAPDVIIVAAYGLLLPQAILDIPRFGCLNIHASLLPRWRGAAPIQRAILAGDQETGITIMQMDKGLDTGDMLLKRSVPITAGCTAGELHDQLAVLGGQAILETLADLAANKLQPENQTADQATYAKKLDKHEAWINWTDTAKKIDRQIRAFNPWPVAQTQIQGSILRIRKAQLIAADTSAPAPPGTIVHANSNGIDVACGEGQIRLCDGQLAGAKPLSAKDLLNGHAQLFTPGAHFQSPVVT